MDTLQNLTLGFQAALSFSNLGFCLAGCLLGTLVGVLPGIGPLATIAMLLPLTFGLEPLPALIMLAGIYYGSAYGGSTTAGLSVGGVCACSLPLLQPTPRASRDDKPNIDTRRASFKLLTMRSSNAAPAAPHTRQIRTISAWWLYAV